MKKKVILLTGSELRHDFFRKFIANDNDIEVLATYCESQKNNLVSQIQKEEHNSFRSKHLMVRSKVEDDFFGIFCEYTKDNSNPIFIEKGDINLEHHVNDIIKLEPDLIISYGCSIIKSRLLTVFENRFINIHLGLSPYYRGSGTNFWPFVNDQLYLIGTTFMYIDAGVDTGEIIHQLRADICYQDSIHQIGNRLIKDSFVECIDIIKQFNSLERLKPLDFDKSNEKYYRNKDFTEDAIKLAYKNINDNKVIEKYMKNRESLYKEYPILKNNVKR